MKKKMKTQQKEEVLCEICGNAVWEVGLKIPIMNIWGMLDWILTQNCRNTLSLHNYIN